MTTTSPKKERFVLSERLKEHQVLLKKRKKRAMISSIILGGQDGVVNVLGVLLAVAFATSNPVIVIIAGIAAAFTESVSMLAVAYTSARADEDYYHGEKERELREIEDIPDIEREEVREIYFNKGFRGQQLDNVVKTITSNKDVWVEVMMQEELKIEKIDMGHARKESYIVGISVVSGSLFPLIPFLFSLPQIGLLGVIDAAYTAAATSITALFLAGFIKAKLTTGVAWRSGLEMAAIGGVAFVLSYLIGYLLRATFGIT